MFRIDTYTRRQPGRQRSTEAHGGAEHREWVQLWCGRSSLHSLARELLSEYVASLVISQSSALKGLADEIFAPAKAVVSVLEAVADIHPAVKVCSSCALTQEGGLY